MNTSYPLPQKPELMPEKGDLIQIDSPGKPIYVDDWLAVTEVDEQAFIAGGYPFLIDQTDVTVTPSGPLYLSRQS